MALDRYQAADIRRFTDATTHAFAFGPQDGYIYYSVEADIILPTGQVSKEAAVFCFHTKQYSQSEVAQGITMLWQALVQEGKIGDTRNPAKPLANPVTLTGNPLNDTLQVADAITRSDKPQLH